MGPGRTRGAPRLALIALLAAAALGAPDQRPLRAAGRAVRVQDSAGRQVVVSARPRRIVSLVPSVTETLFAIGAGDSVAGVTHHERRPARIHSVAVVGGFGAPSPEAILALEPDLVIVSRIHSRLRPALEGVALLELDDVSIEGFYRRTRELGRLTGRARAADDLVRRMRRRFRVLEQKVARIPENERRRVARLMQLDGAMAPGDDSFQVELIRAAGGIPPSWGLNGQVVSPTAAAWRTFDPQVIYACGGERDLLERMRADPVFRELSAVRNGEVHDFPCALTCRTSIHSGDFAERLAAQVYPESLASPAARLKPDARLRRRDLKSPVPGFGARLVTSRIDDFEHSSLVLDLPRPMTVLSSLEGRRTGVRAVVNHGLHPAAWHALHARGPEAMSRRVGEVLGLAPDTTAMLLTGADASTAVLRAERHGDLAAAALVTAGVASNAQRAGADEGGWLEHGTINIVLVTSARLSERAMVRAIITATEAKTAALQDLDIRSSYLPEHQATGTGTDNIAVVEGSGPPADNTGGHSKLGELIGRAVRAAVTEAVARQNHLVPGRGIFARLEERGLGLEVLAGWLEGRVAAPRRAAVRLELLLLEPRVAGLVAAALAVADAQARGQTGDTGALEAAAASVLAQAAELERVKPLEALPPGDRPEVLDRVLALLLGAAAAQPDEAERLHLIEPATGICPASKR